MTRHAAVVGGGTMGAGIAHVLLAAGDHVVLAEAGVERAAAAKRAVATSLRKAEDRGKLDSSADELLERLEVVEAISQLPPATELVIEAVPEDVALKKKVLADIRKACPDALLASNTSSLSIRQLGGDVVGMHFFNPVPVQALLELVVHDDLDPAQVIAARNWGESLGKTVIEVRDSPGFATSRLGVVVGLEAIRMLEEDVASAEDIDTGMRLGYGWPMGPLRLTDLVGLDVRLSIAEHLTKELGPRFTPPELLRNKVARGELGRKTGRGFFDWS